MPRVMMVNGHSIIGPSTTTKDQAPVRCCDRVRLKGKVKVKSGHFIDIAPPAPRPRMLSIRSGYECEGSRDYI